MEVGASGKESGVTGSAVAAGVGGALQDHEAAVQVLVDALQQVGDPQGGEHRVGRVVVGPGGASPGWSQPVTLGVPVGGSGAASTVERPAEHDRHRRRLVAVGRSPQVRSGTTVQ